MTNPTDTNQASEDMVDDFYSLPPTSRTKANLRDYIRTEKLKLLAEVRERVVGKNQHSEHKEWDCPCGVTHSFTEEWHATNRLRDEQRAALTAIETKLEAEL